jgi:hypothetical protein
MSRRINPTTYCRRQAAECARRALEAMLAEVREAYVDLEQGWLQLVPGPGGDQETSAGGRVGRRTTSQRPDQR